MKWALLIIDLQKAYQNRHNKDYMRDVSEYINAVIPLFRKRNLPIVWVQHKDEADGAIPGKEAFDYIDELRPDAADYRIAKEYNNSFNKTELRNILQKNSVDTILITGYSAEYCVLSTYKGAQDLDITPVMLKNGICSDEKQNAEFVEKICNIISYGVIYKLLTSE